jgi:uncharacterized protein YndB with AHSA1/START domain
MAEPEAPVEVEMTIAARPETIFRYFTDPARFARWMGEAAVLEPEAGGRLRVAYPTGQVASGQVVTVEPPRRVVFTWGYEGEDQVVPAGSSIVEIILDPVADGTRVRLRHSGLPAGEPPAAHLAGWRHTLATLAYAASADQLAPVLTDRVADWLAAWNEPDPAARSELLGRCLADGGRFRDPTAAVDGASQLGDHIGTVRQLAGGVRLVGRGSPQQCHGVVRFGWAAVGPGGVVLATGVNVAGTDLDGRFRWLTGFWDPAPDSSGPPGAADPGAP